MVVPASPDPVAAEFLASLDATLAASLADRHLSRGERQGLRSLLASLPAGVDPIEVRRRAFEVARSALARVEASDGVTEWLHDVVALVDNHVNPSRTVPRWPGVAEAHFSPGQGCRMRISQLLHTARACVDICVFTITDDRISEAILAAHARGVTLRIMTDNEKAEDLGSDIPRFRAAGIPLCIDRSPAHMHHKYAIFDSALLLTGSYNWTRGAAEDNEENFIVTSDERHVGPFLRAFQELWERLRRQPRQG